MPQTGLCRCRLDVRITPKSGHVVDIPERQVRANNGHRHRFLDHLVGELLVRVTDVTEYLARSRASLRLDVGRPDYFAPLLGFVGDEPAEVARRTRNSDAPQIGETRLNLGIGEARIDF